MGIYTEYLDAALTPEQLKEQRQEQLAKISKLRGGRDVLVIAADLMETEVHTGILYDDLLPIQDQLANLHGDSLDLILETPGGYGEIAEQIVRLIRAQYSHVAIIVPGRAMSAGTIMAMAADEILMDAGSALGPIDAQLTWQGKMFSAHALLEGIEQIKEEATASGTLNPAYIAILHMISPGELVAAKNALDFARELVTDWLARFKFKDWTHHSSTGEQVTDHDRHERAKEIAGILADHTRWKTHGRGILIDDLRNMKLKITDFSESPELSEAIQRYHTLLQITFDMPYYKLFETPVSGIFRAKQVQLQQLKLGERPASAQTVVNCGKCGNRIMIQANLMPGVPLQPGCVPYPRDNVLPCPTCGEKMDLTTLREKLERESGGRVVA